MSNWNNLSNESWYTLENLAYCIFFPQGWGSDSAWGSWDKRSPPTSWITCISTSVAARMSTFPSHESSHPYPTAQHSMASWLRRTPGWNLKSEEPGRFLFLTRNSEDFSIFISFSLQTCLRFFIQGVNTLSLDFSIFLSIYLFLFTILHLTFC